VKFPRTITLGLILGMLGMSVTAWAANPPDQDRVPDSTLVLDTGVAARLTDLGDGPYVVVPIFTRCRAVCSLVAKSLKAAWGDGGGQDASARIVLISFDPQDTPADMARFRDLFELPRSWHLATIEREEGLKFFSALGFRWRTLAERRFDHSGKIFVISDELRIASVLGPDQLTTERLEERVVAAETGASLARRIGTHWIGFFGVGVILLGLLVVVTWDKVRSRRQVVTS
jgi:cytochrome oxidase Cu insertion factor (SCO1/SenC/PrrC family)